MKVYQINNEMASNMPAGKDASFQGGYHIFALKWLLLVLLVVGCVVFSISRDPPPKSHYSALCVPRFDHKALTLSDGRVLAVGGYHGRQQMLASAEIFDPELRFWRRVADMPEPMSPKYMWQLSDGRVLVYGYVRMEDYLIDQIFLYDVHADYWLAGPLMEPGAQSWLDSAAYQQERLQRVAEAKITPEWRMHFGATAVLMDGDQLLVSGGILRNMDRSQYKHEETLALKFDIAQAQWQVVAPMLEARSGHALTLLTDGRVLAVGGGETIAGKYVSLRSAEIYDPRSNVWQEVAPMHGVHLLPRLVLLLDGRMVVTGGSDDVIKVQVGDGKVEERKWMWQGIMEVYDPEVDRWEQVLTDTPQIRQLLPMADGRVAALHDVLDTWIMVWDPHTNEWSAALRPDRERSHVHMVQLTDGRLMVSGGQAEITRFKSRTFEPVDTVDFLNLPPI